MKRETIVMACALIALASCSRETLPSSDNGGRTARQDLVEAFSFSALSAGESSKTALADETGAVHWCEGDEIAVYDDKDGCTGHRFTSAIDPSDSSRAVFSGEVCSLSESFTAIYPFDHTQIPSVQTAVEGSFADGTVFAFASASRQDSIVAFKNTGTALSFVVPSYISDLQSVTISSNSGVAICGAVDVDIKTGQITADPSSESAATSPSVTLQGSFTAGGRYYAGIIPGVYAGGVTLSLHTASGLDYSRSTTRDINALAGHVYNLGTAGFVPQLTASAVIEHTTDADGRLDGSVAVFSVQGLGAGQASLIKDWDVSLTAADGTVVRTIKQSSGTMSIANSYSYIPQGDYTLEVNCFMQDGAVRTYSFQASSPAPSFTLSTTGYASYDCYCGSNGRSKSVSDANACDANTIYDLSTSVSISNDIITDPKYSSLYSYSLDNGYETGIVSGNGINLGDKGGMERKEHTFSVSCTFDGVKVSGSRSIHVTGLPHIANPPSNQGINPWEKMEGSVSWGSSYVECASKSQADYPRIGSPYFHIPASVSVKVSPKIYRGGWYSTLGTYYLRITLNSDDHIVKETKFGKGDTFDTEFTATMTSSLNRWRVQYRYAATGVNMQVYKFNVYYN